MRPGDKALAWIEAYSMAIQGAAVTVPRDGKLTGGEVHRQACWFADNAVDALTERFASWADADKKR